MATEKINVLDPQGVQDLTLALFRKTELQIDARIIQELTEAATAKQIPSAAVVKALYDALHAKDEELEGKIDQVKSEVGDNVSATLTGLTGKVTTLEETTASQGTKITEVESKANQNATNIATINGKIATIENNVATNTSAIEDANRAITELSAAVSAFTHLEIVTVVGSIDSIVEPRQDVLYFQKDNEEDPTWVLYIYKPAVVEGEGEEAVETSPAKWIPVGDTSIDLVNYWRKDDIDAMKEALGIKDIVAMTEEEIITAVNTAFDEFVAESAEGSPAESPEA